MSSQVVADALELFSRLTAQLAACVRGAQAADHASHVASEDSRQTVACKRQLLRTLSFQELGRRPHVARNMNDVEDFNQRPCETVQGGRVPQAVLAVNQQHQRLARLMTALDLARRPAEGFMRGTDG